MWNYDKLFAIGNIIGFYVPLIEKYTVHVIDEKQKNILYNYYKNKLLSYLGPIISYEDMKTKIQYIIRLDEHGNVIEKLFDREKDMPNFMPELKTGMFVKVLSNMGNNNVTYGYVDKENDRIILQNGEWFQLNKLLYEIEHFNPLTEIIAIYDNVVSFNHCLKSEPIWHK